MVNSVAARNFYRRESTTSKERVPDLALVAAMDKEYEGHFSSNKHNENKRSQQSSRSQKTLQSQLSFGDFDNEQEITVVDEILFAMDKEYEENRRHFSSNKHFEDKRSKQSSKSGKTLRCQLSFGDFDNEQEIIVADETHCSMDKEYEQNRRHFSSNEHFEDKRSKQSTKSQQTLQSQFSFGDFDNEQEIVVADETLIAPSMGRKVIFEYEEKSPRAIKHTRPITEVELHPVNSADDSDSKRTTNIWERVISTSNLKSAMKSSSKTFRKNSSRSIANRCRENKNKNSVTFATAPTVRLIPKRVGEIEEASEIGNYLDVSAKEYHLIADIMDPEQPGRVARAEKKAKKSKKNAIPENYLCPEVLNPESSVSLRIALKQIKKKREDDLLDQLIMSVEVQSSQYYSFFSE